MKYLFFTLFVFFILDFSFQDNKGYIIKYTETNLKSKVSVNGVLKGYAGNSVYVTDKKNISSKSKGDALKSELSEKFIPKQIYFKNRKNNELLLEIEASDQPLLVKKKLNSYNWILLEESKKIGKYDCKKAKSKNKWGYVIAWYTDELGVVGAPSEYDGLPGLIVYLETPYKKYELNKIEFTNDIKLPKPTDGVRIVTQKDLEEGVKTTKKGTEKAH